MRRVRVFASMWRVACQCSTVSLGSQKRSKGGERGGVVCVRCCSLVLANLGSLRGSISERHPYSARVQRRYGTASRHNDPQRSLDPAQSRQNRLREGGCEGGREGGCEAWREGGCEAWSEGGREREVEGRCMPVWCSPEVNVSCRAATSASFS